ncbi:mitotic-spindle organizing gamma-tubulin ring associated-domain-containing protein [Amylocarpus encephaloides]|uniref:Mitotic-spindle organizing protein 1 n=1 Tax=Amylocarpus encephaloides TaxID=45428 RepID=A0A9P7YKY9_9HELO|nr:mitotic-spindle organizing gamma-tubulin ring associated-domain-containing protein [Amylocarpus encephaloides]
MCPSRAKVYPEETPTRLHFEIASPPPSLIASLHFHLSYRLATMPDSRQDKELMAAQARQVIDVFHEISILLNADLDRQTMSICISLIENGVNPEALASVVKELKKEGEETKRAMGEAEGQG